MDKSTRIYIGKKLLQFVISMIVLILVVFVVSRLAPGDPLRAYYGEAVERMSLEQLAHAEHRLGLDQSLAVQFFDWLGQVFQGDFGISFQYKRSVMDVIGDVAGNTAVLALVSFIIISLCSLALAIFCVRREGKTVDRVICKLGVMTGSVPEFFMAMIFIMVFSVILGILPQSGAVSVGGGGFLDRAVHLILPVAAISVSHIWYCTYLMRSRLSDEMSKDYVLLCMAKGLSEKQTVYRHCVRNITPSVVGIMAVFLPHLLAGAYVVEVVFSYPGMGKLAVESAQYHDYNLLMMVCIITGATVITVNIIADIIRRQMDPELKQERGQLL